jgi:hypothetical protein
MTARQIAANRANARASTGPKTPAGRARAAANARRHGLSLSALANARRPAEVETLAQTIVTDVGGGNTDLLPQARTIAEVQLDLARIRQARHELVMPTLTDAAMAALLAIERYERRALSRRKFAIRDFGDAQTRLAIDEPC